MIKRTKEIGVRKILGASVVELWGMLSKDFVKLVIISQLIASPIAYWDGAITMLTVSYQSIRAALANPVKSLRNE